MSHFKLLMFRTDQVDTEGLVCLPPPPSDLSLFSLWSSLSSPPLCLSVFSSCPVFSLMSEFREREFFFANSTREDGPRQLLGCEEPTFALDRSLWASSRGVSPDLSSSTRMDAGRRCGTSWAGGWRNADEFWALISVH